MLQVFSKEWFEKHQQKLRWFANTKIGRYTLRINGDRSSVGKNKIARINTNSITWVKNYVTREVVTEFRPHDKFAKRLYYAFRPMWWLMHGWDWVTFQQPRWNLGFDTLTQYPESTGADNPIAGRTVRSGIDENWATIRAGAGTLADTTPMIQVRASATTNQFDAMGRSIFCYDTSALTASATISAAVLSLYGTTAPSNDFAGTTPECDIVEATPASTSALATSDFANYGTTTFSSIAWTSLVSSGYSNFTLNADGRDNISLTSITKFGGRINWDTDDDFTGTWASGKNCYFLPDAASETGASPEPKLVVTYTLPASGTTSRLLLGVG